MTMQNEHQTNRASSDHGGSGYGRFTASLLLANAEGAGVSLTRIGTVGGDALRIGTSLDVSLNALWRAHEGWLPDYMGVPPAVAASS